MNIFTFPKVSGLAVDTENNSTHHKEKAKQCFCKEIDLQNIIISWHGWHLSHTLHPLHTHTHTLYFYNQTDSERNHINIPPITSDEIQELIRCLKSFRFMLFFLWFQSISIVMINIFLILNIDIDCNYDVANMPGTYYTLLLKIFNNKLLNLVSFC